MRKSDQHSTVIYDYQFKVFWHFKILVIPMKRNETCIGMLAHVPLS